MTSSTLQSTPRFLSKSLILTLAFFAPGANAEQSKTVFVNAKVHTVNARAPRAQAFVVEGRRFTFVGGTAEAINFAGPGATQVDLGGQMVMPGINEGHIHPAWGTLKDLFTCAFPMSVGAAELAAALKSCTAQVPAGKWIRGGAWGSDFFARTGIKDPRAWLAEIAPEHPVYLTDDSGHDGWINDLAIRKLGIGADTPDPEGGFYERDARGVPTGILRETAMREVRPKIPAYTKAQWRDAMAQMSGKLNAYGITGARDAGLYTEAYAALRAQGRGAGFSLHYGVSLRAPYGHRDLPLDVEQYKRDTQATRSATVDTRYLKIFLDGVPTPARTAAMLRPYLTDEAHPHETFGELYMDAESLAVDLINFDRAGYSIKLHTAGDRSVHVALNAIEHMREENGFSGRYVELAHAGLVAPEDIPRFAKLDAIADLSPALWFPSNIIDAIVSAVGERGLLYFPTRDFLDAGVLVTGGSDWPSVADTPDPWRGIESMVTRANPEDSKPGALWPEQAITLTEAIKIYTLNGAKALRLDHMTGTIEAGKYADFIVLNQNIFEVPVNKVSETQVLETWFMGKRVYQRQ